MIPFGHCRGPRRNGECRNEPRGSALSTFQAARLKQFDMGIMSPRGTLLVCAAILFPAEGGKDGSEDVYANHIL
jgi:hypothetical protein